MIVRPTFLDPLAVMVDGRWRPGIGDPTVLGWVTVVAYLAAALLAGMYATAVGRARGRPDRIRRTLVWWALAVLLVFLAINKQLDLQSWFTAMFRGLARSQGWYDLRREAQAVFVVAIGIAGAASVMAAFRAVRRSLREDGLPLAGAMFLVVFVVIRAASFHRIDRFLGFSPGGLRMNWLLELGGIALVIAGAVRGLRRRVPPDGDVGDRSPDPSRRSPREHVDRRGKSS